MSNVRKLRGASRKPSPRDVACPHCKASPGQPCVVVGSGRPILDYSQAKPIKDAAGRRPVFNAYGERRPIDPTTVRRVGTTQPRVFGPDSVHQFHPSRYDAAELPLEVNLTALAKLHSSGWVPTYRLEAAASQLADDDSDDEGGPE